MESSSTVDQKKQKLKTLRIQCKNLGISAAEEQTLDVLASQALPLAIGFAEKHIQQAELKRKNDELERKNDELERKNDELERKNDDLERKNFETLDLVQSSIQNTYGKTVADFKQPPIELNTGVAPSVGGNARKAVIKDSEGKEKYITMKIPTVKIEQERQEIWVDVSNVTIPVVTPDGKMIGSVLGTKWNPREKFTYLNEFTVQSYCEDMIRDALKALGLIDKAGTHLELSMYLMKPDIVIVVKHQGRVFFAAEVKAPEVQGKNNVFGNEMVAGQIWSYLYAMKASGNPCPIGAIMTYNKISIVTLGDYSKDGKHKSRIRATKASLSTGRSPLREPPKEAKAVKCESRKHSPIKLIKDFTKTNQEDNEVMQQELWDEEVGRIAYCSPVHGNGEVFPCLLQAIDIAYRAICDADAEQVVSATAKAPIGGRLVFKLGEDSFRWVKMPRHVLAEIDGKIPTKTTKYLYILGKLGDGGNASVYLACSSGGKVCAMKDYFIERSSAACEMERDKEENAQRMHLIEMAEKEEARWERIYCDRFQARAQSFGGKHCLLMPYGYQIAAEPDDRWRHIPGIKKELELFARCTEGEEGRPGYKYKNSDLRWRHVLLDTKGDIFLCDLESLEEIGENKCRDEVVYEQLAILLHPMRNKLKEQGTLNWLRSSKTADVVSFIRGVGTLKDFFEEGSSRNGYTKGTKQYGEIVKSLSAATFEELSADPRAVVTLCMISHYRNEYCTLQQCESSEGRISLPVAVDSKCTGYSVRANKTRRTDQESE